jgi:nitrogen-specific signal transduction histidine kinase
MSPERTQAYKRVMRTLSDLGPTKLLADEQDRIRTAADTLIFAAHSDGETIDDALGDVDELCRDLVASGRWEPVTAERLARDLRGCSPRGDADEALRAA